MVRESLLCILGQKKKKKKVLDVNSLQGIVPTSPNTFSEYRKNYIKEGSKGDNGFVYNFRYAVALVFSGLVLGLHMQSLFRDKSVLDSLTVASQKPYL